MIADSLGWTLDRITDEVEPKLAQVTISSEFLAVDPGYVCGIVQDGVGYRKKEPVIRLYMEAYLGAPEPYDPIEIDGTPRLSVKIAGGVHGDVATAAIVVNSIPKVLAAAPGLHTMRDCRCRRSFAGNGHHPHENRRQMPAVRCGAAGERRRRARRDQVRRLRPRHPADVVGTRADGQDARSLSGVRRRGLLHPQGLRSEDRPDDRHHRRRHQRVFYWFKRDLIAYSILAAATLVDLAIYGRLKDLSVCYRCHTEFRGPEARNAPAFDLHTADVLEQEIRERKIGRR